MSKEEASDLTSLIDRRVQCELELQRAQFALDKASADLANFMWKVSHKKQENG